MTSAKAKQATAKDDPKPEVQAPKPTMAQEIYDRVQVMIAEGTDKSDAFRQLADEAERPYDSIRGSYYSHKKKLEGGIHLSKFRWPSVKRLTMLSTLDFPSIVTMKWCTRSPKVALVAQAPAITSE